MYQPWHCPTWSNHTFSPLVLTPWRMVSELMKHNKYTVLFLEKVWTLWFCMHLYYISWCLRSCTGTSCGSFEHQNFLCLLFRFSHNVTHALSEKQVQCEVLVCQSAGKYYFTTVIKYGHSLWKFCHFIWAFWHFTSKNQQVHRLSCFHSSGSVILQ